MLTLPTIIAAGLLAALPLLSLVSGRAARLCDRLAGPAERLVRGVFFLSALSAIILAIVQMTVVVLVSIFAVSLVWLQETTLYLFGAMFLLGAGAVLLDDGHVRVDVFYGRFSKRRRAAVDLAGLTLFVLPVCALVIIASGPYVAQSWAELERSNEPSGLHLVYILKSMIPAFAGILGLAAFVKARAAANALTQAGG